MLVPRCPPELAVFRCRCARVVGILYRKPNFVLVLIDIMSCTKTINT